MKPTFFKYSSLIAALFFSFLVGAEDLFEDQLYDITKEGYEQYEDIYVQGRVIKKASNGERYSDERFAIIDSILGKYSRPFTVLDVGSAQGYFSFRGAEKYPESTFVMLEGSNIFYPLISKQVASICKLNEYLKNVIWLDNQIVVSDLVELSEYEHFDVVLALNILHWFPDQWEELLNGLVTMSHITIVELPPVDDNLTDYQIESRTKMHQFLSQNAKEIRVGVPRHTNYNLMTTYYILENNGPFSLKKKSVLHSGPDIKDRTHQVYYDFETIYFIKKDLQTPFKVYFSEWNPGINLLTYLKFNGQWPLREMTVTYLPLDTSHKDWMPNNMIIKGQSMALVDFNDNNNLEGGIGGTIQFSVNMQNKIEELILRSTPDTLKVLFDKLFIGTD